MFGDTGGEGGRGGGLENAGDGVGARGAVGELEPFAQPGLAQFGELLHEFVGSHATEDGGEGDEEDLAEMMEGVASVAGGGKRAEGVEAFGEALGIVGFVGISGHPRSLKTPDMEYKSVSFPWVVFSLMEGHWRGLMIENRSWMES